jgi:hypothetical protein
MVRATAYSAGAAGELGALRVDPVTTSGCLDRPTPASLHFLLPILVCVIVPRIVAD